MSDWLAFIESVPWFVDPGADVQISEPRQGQRLPSDLDSTFAPLSSLLAKARVTPVCVAGACYQLYSWQSRDGCRTGWLCLPPVKNPPDQLQRLHVDLLRSFGGIIERFNEPEDTWLLNTNESLTVREASQDARFLADYSWAFDEAGLELPIDPTEYYSISREANGNTTLCHCETGNIILFAPDHSFDFVVPLAGCPEYTLYQLDGITTLRDWVCTVAEQWLGHVVST
ncbi:MAG: hypothetical protein AAF581_03160 [Planctomycetota bacterium]